MNTRRFYVEPGTLELKREFWINDETLKNRFNEGLKEGDELVLFDGVGEDRLYKLSRVEPDGIQLQMVTELERNLPKKHIYIFWTLLPGDKNEEILRKCTELGVSNFVPLVTENSVQTIDMEHVKEILSAAAELGQWSLVPHIREPLNLEEMNKEYEYKFASSEEDETLGVILGYTADWSEVELSLFRRLHLILAPGENPTDTAVTAIEKLLQ